MLDSSEPLIYSYCEVWSEIDARFGGLKKKDILCRIITVFTKVIHLNLHLPPTRSVHGVCICSDSAVCIHSQPFGPGKKQVCSSNHMTAQRGVRSGLYMTHSYMAVFIMDIVKKNCRSVCDWPRMGLSYTHTHRVNQCSKQGEARTSAVFAQKNLKGCVEEEAYWFSVLEYILCSHHQCTLSSFTL